ncbi:hypothetical protein Pelo_11675 [Pelomyxa schiedti]|nr:hypothetical protein Pelo_11675 [Pelomyxa schiedti]
MVVAYYPVWTPLGLLYMEPCWNLNRKKNNNFNTAKDKPSILSYLQMSSFHSLPGGFGQGPEAGIGGEIRIQSEYPPVKRRFLFTTLKKQGGLPTPLLDMRWWNVATAVSAYRNPNRHNPTNKDGTSPIWEIALLNKHIPAHMSTPTDIYRSIMKERPTKPLHHKLHTAMNTPPTETNWLNLVKNLNTPRIPPSIRNQALK